jgi:hypothetical protein
LPRVVEHCARSGVRVVSKWRKVLLVESYAGTTIYASRFPIEHRKGTKGSPISPRRPGRNGVYVVDTSKRLLKG